MLTEGWDLLAATPLATVNVALRAITARLPKQFDTGKSALARFHGTFGEWSISPDSSGKLLHLEIGLASGTCEPSFGAAYDITGVSVTLQVSLDLLPSPHGPGQFVFTISTPGSAQGGLPRGVAPYSLNDPKGVIQPFHSKLLLTGLALLLQSNAATVSWILATLNPMLQGGSPSWMQIQQCRYSMLTVKGSGSSLIVHGVTTQRDISQLGTTTDPKLLSGNEAVIAAAPGLFLEKIVGPGIGAALKATLARQPDGSIAATNVALDASFIPCISSAVASHIAAQVVDDHIIVNIDGVGDAGLGTSITFSSSTHFTVTFDPATGRANLVMVGKPIFDSELHQSTAGIAARIALFAGGLLCPVAAPALFAAGLAASIPSMLETSIHGLHDRVKQAVDLSRVHTAAGAILNWTGTSGFRLKTGYLETAFVVRGEFR